MAYVEFTAVYVRMIRVRVRLGAERRWRPNTANLSLRSWLDSITCGNPYLPRLRKR